MDKIKKLLTNKWFLIIVGLILLVASPPLFLLYLGILAITWIIRKRRIGLVKNSEIARKNGAEKKSIWTRPLSQKTIWIAAVVAVLFVIGFVNLISNTDFQGLKVDNTLPPYTTQEYEEAQYKRPLGTIEKIGEEGFLRFSGSDAVPVPIAVNLEDYDALKKVLAASDEYGLLELLAEGRLFGVSKGTQVRIIDKSGVLLRVRILEGVNPVDEDKVGRSGWVPGGWVYAQ